MNLLRLPDVNRRQSVGLIVVALVTVGLSASVLAGLAAGPSAGTIELSNQKKVNLGVSRKDLVKSLGSSLKLVSDTEYNYLSPSGNVEGVMLVLEDRLVGFRAEQNQANKQLASDAYVGIGIPAIRSKLSAGLRPIPPSNPLLTFYGYSWANDDFTSFYFTNPCKDDGAVARWAVAEKGQEAFVVGKVDKLICPKAK